MDETGLQLVPDGEIDVKFRFTKTATDVSDPNTFVSVSHDFTVIFQHNCRAAITPVNTNALSNKNIRIGKEKHVCDNKSIKASFIGTQQKVHCVRPYEGVFIRTHWGLVYDAL